MQKLFNIRNTKNHKQIGQSMDLFHFDKCAIGSIFWHSKGWFIFQKLILYIRYKQNQYGYMEINTPEIMNKNIWDKSGHWKKFKHNMFISKIFNKLKIYIMRPMNCPGSIKVYKKNVKSYKHLPFRLSEFGKVYRYEPSGSLYGLMRSRLFTQDDAHIFCLPNQINIECIALCKLIKLIYDDFNFKNIEVRFANKPTYYIGSNKMWNIAEKSLLKAIIEQNINFVFNKKGGAFYGPKIEFVLKDILNRKWQMGTVQIDLNMSKRLGITFTDFSGTQHRPIVLHRAIFGSIERFLGILLEQNSGILPLWLTPIQIVIIAKKNNVYYINKIKYFLDKIFIRYKIDTLNEKINYKIKKYFTARVPILIIIGNKECIMKSVSIRRIGTMIQEILELNKFINIIERNIKRFK